jgi:hypothetical protein
MKFYRLAVFALRIGILAWLCQQFMAYLVR